ncbi:MAG: hypothetical protein ACK8QZ_01930 [Anaerolineales bacterium]
MTWKERASQTAARWLGIAEKQVYILQAKDLFERETMLPAWDDRVGDEPFPTFC